MTKFSKFLDENPKIKIGETYYYRHHYCEHCGKRIKFPDNPITLVYQVYNGVPKFILNHQNVGRNLSKNHKDKISKTMTGRRKRRKCSKEFKEKMSKVQTGRKRSILEIMNNSLSHLIIESKKRGEI